MAMSVFAPLLSNRLMAHLHLKKESIFCSDLMLSALGFGNALPTVLVCACY